MRIPGRSPSCFVLASCLLLMGCAGSDDIQPSAPATIITATDDSGQTAQADQDSSSPEPSTEAASGDEPTGSDEPTGDTPAEASTTEDSGDTSTTEGSGGEGASEQTDDGGDTTDGPASNVDLGSFLPSADLISDTTVSEYLTLAELIADRSEQPPVLRCGAVTDPSSLAISSQGQSAGRVFNDNNGVHTVTVQLWNYPNESVASEALAAVRDLRCEALPVGDLVVDGTTYEQFDTLTTTAAQLAGSAIDDAAGASFQRRLDSPNGDLVVSEELQLARLGTVVVFVGAREIGSPEIAPSPPIPDALRVGQLTITAIAEALGRTIDPAHGFTAPIILSVAGGLSGDTDSAADSRADAGTYRSTTTDFCLVRIERNDGQTAQVSWGGGEQGVLTLSPTDRTVDVGSGCGMWTRIVAGSDTAVPPGGVGTLIVGTDIEPGGLVVTSTGECTIDQLLGFSGAPADLVASTLLAPGESVEISVTTEAGITLSSGCRY